MANNNQNSGGGSAVGVILVIIILIGLIGSCGSSDDEYRDTLDSGLEKYYNGDKMSKDEYDAVKGFNKWKDKQGEKTYDDWD